MKSKITSYLVTALVVVTLAGAADYDGDGRMDAAVYRAGTWYINGTTEGISILPFGAPGDLPVNGVYLS